MCDENLKEVIKKAEGGDSEAQFMQPIIKIGDKVKYKKGVLLYRYNGDDIYTEDHHYGDNHIIEKGVVSNVGNTSLSKYDVYVTYEGRTVKMSSHYTELQSIDDINQNEEKFQELIKKAESGDSQAQYELGNYYYEICDKKKAEFWFIKSAKQGHAMAKWSCYVHFGHNGNLHVNDNF